MNSISADEPQVYVVDDSPDGIAFISHLCETVGMHVHAYTNPADFLREFNPRMIGCLMLDLRMPEMSGIELQNQLSKRQSSLETIVITNHPDVDTCREAFRSGVFDFVRKDDNPQLILDVIQRAMKASRQKSRHVALAEKTAGQLALLTSREREVLELLVNGKPLKEIARELQITVQTASRHRSRVMEKLQVDNEVELLLKLLPLRANSV